MQKIAQGAEAVLYREENKVLKERLPKNYRIPQIDESLRKFRTRREAKILQKMQQLNFPSPRLIEMNDKKMQLSMDFIPGKKLRDIFAENPDYYALAREMGSRIGQLHQQDIIHGDLTTSNMIVHEKDKKIYFIDFGLSFFSDKVEDKAVDLFLLNRALESKHWQFYPDIFEKALEGYYSSYPEARTVMDRYEQVMKRGRNKSKKL